MEILTERLLLREFHDKDWEAVIDYQVEPLYLRYCAWKDRSPTDVQASIDWFIAAQHELPRRNYQLAVVDRSSGKLIGNCGLRLNDGTLNEGDIGYEIAHTRWGQGLATEAAREMLRLGFEDLGLHRIWATCVSENIASAKVMVKLGMRLEGTLVERDFYKGKWWDHRLYAILDREWARVSAT